MRPGIFPVLTGVHSKDWFHMRAWPRYLAGFAGKSAALMLAPRGIKFIKKVGTAPVSIQAQGIGVDLSSMLSCSPGDLSVAFRARGPIVIGSAVIRVNPRQLQLYVRLTGARPRHAAAKKRSSSNTSRRRSTK
ncbi:MAG: hypothetical protein BMS9Abin05_2675 [Rhodothermia bacterium]|nr:MAG: hypothetical protein BMS9Abin05_2675 [Rhodothermia bacterium]